MFRKAILYTLASALLITSSAAAGRPVSAASASAAVNIIVNGETANFPDAPPFINADNITMVPLRFVSEKLGAAVAWDAASRTAEITDGSKIIELPLDSAKAKVNGTDITLDSPAVLAGDYTMVPLRFVSEVLGSKVTWIAEKNAVNISNKLSAQAVAFADPELEKVIRGKLKKPQGELTTDDVEGITSIDSEDTDAYTNSRIRKLDGIGQLVNLTSLNLAHNLIEDISPLSNNTKLTSLSLAYNKIENIQPLAGLTELTVLRLDNNFIKDISGLAGLVNLETLSLYENQIKQISMLDKLDKLTSFSAADNIISDVSVFRQMDSLETIFMNNNPVLDGEPMKPYQNVGTMDYKQMEQAGKMAHEMANSILQTAVTDEEKNKAVFTAIVEHVQYDSQFYNRGVETKTDAGGLFGALVEQSAVCGGYAVAMKVLGELVGLDVIYLEGMTAAVPDSEYEWKAHHAWNLVRVNGAYTHVNPTWGEGQFETSPPVYNYLSLTDQQNEAGLYWDQEYYPKTKPWVPTAQPQMIQVHVNSEIPVEKDLAVWLKVSTEYESNGYKALNLKYVPVIFHGGEKSLSVNVGVPGEVPLNTQSVRYGLSYELFKLYPDFKTEDTDFSYYGYSRGDGYTDLTSSSNATLKPGDDLYITLLKKNSQGISYNQVVAKDNEADYVLDESVFELFVKEHFPQPDGSDYKLYSIRNNKALTIPPYSAVYVTAGTNYVEFNADYYNYNFGGKAVVANHTGQPKTIPAGSISYDVNDIYRDDMGTVSLPDGTKMKLAGTGPYIRMISFDGDFDEKKEYKDYYDQKNKILNMGSWFPMKNGK